ncbi:MAG: helix-turn-helix transcriptional regulator [Bacteroidota bacterium]
MEYQTYPVSDDLNSFVKCYWTLEGAKETLNKRQTIVPDGCMEMIFHFGDPYLQYDPLGNATEQPRAFVFGPLTRKLEIAPTGDTRIFAVRFHPDGLAPFTATNIKSMTNTAVDVCEVFAGESAHLYETLSRLRSTADRMRAVESFLLSQLRSEETIDRMISQAIDTIIEVKGQCSVDDLSSIVNVHRRKLERKFASKVGLGVKQLSQIVRMQSTLKQLLSNDFENLTAVAYGEGFYDQAHFIKDFKAFTGQTPKDYYSDHLKMSALFYGDP